MSDAESIEPQRKQYRRAYNSGTWHFSEECPAWPLRNFVESENAEFSRLCMDCHKLLTRPAQDFNNDP